MARWQLGSVVVFLVIFGLTALITGSVLFFMPALVLAFLVFAYACFNWVLTKRIEQRHDSLEDAMSDETEPLPSSHLIPDDRTPAGDTPEAHDEINPHDLPPDHPGRQAAEAQAGGDEQRGEARTTRGDADPSQAGEERSDRFNRPRAERGG